jgi:hypothetical protein
MAEREIDQMAVFASSIDFFGFMSSPYQEEIQTRLEKTATLEGLIITGADRVLGFEKVEGSVIQGDDPPRFKTGFGLSKDQPFLPLQIEEQRNATIRAVYSTIDYPVLLDILKQTFIAVLSSFCLAFITLMLLIVFAKNQDNAPTRREDDDEKSDDIDAFFNLENDEDNLQTGNSPNDVDGFIDTEGGGDAGQSGNESDTIDDLFDTEDGGDAGQDGNELDTIDDLFDTEDGGDAGQNGSELDTIDDLFDIEDDGDAGQDGNEPDTIDDLFDTENSGDAGQNGNDLDMIDDLFDTEDGGDADQNDNEPDTTGNFPDAESGGDKPQSDGPTDLDDFFKTEDEGDDASLFDDTIDFVDFDEITDTEDAVDRSAELDQPEYADEDFNFPEIDGREEETEPEEKPEEHKAEEPPPNEPVHRGLYSPRGNIGWEDYTGDRLEAELDRCADADQDLVFLALEFKDKKVMGDTLYRQIANEAVKFFKHRDLIFEKGKRGISIIVPSQALEGGMSQCEQFHAQVLSKLSDALSGKNDLCMGVSSRLGRKVDSERLMFEAFQALDKALDDPDSPVIGFKSDPEKYETFIRSRGQENT